MSVYTRINELFDIKTLLQTRNPIREALGITKVELDKGKGSNSIQLHIEEQTRGRQRILLYDTDKEGKSYGYFRYDNRTYTNDSGDVIQFIANRLKSKKTHDAISFLNRYHYRSQVEEWKKHEDFAITTKNRNGSKSMPLQLDELHNLRDISQTILAEAEHYLETHRKIENDVIMSPLFVETIMLYEHTVETETGPIVFTNTLFPKFDIQTNEIKGAEVKTAARTNNNFCLGRDEMLWHSNKPETVNKIVVCESAIDALSHFQLNPKDNQNTWYFSTNGNFYPSRQGWLYQCISAEGLHPEEYSLVLAFDRDHQGFQYDLSMINKVLEDRHPSTSVGVQEFFTLDNIDGKPCLRFHCTNQTTNQAVQQWFFNIQDHFNENALAKRENGMIHIHNSNDRLNLVFPSVGKMKDVTMRLSSSLVRNIPILSNSNIKIEKANFKGKGFKDWNEVVQKNTQKQKVEGKKQARSKKA